MFYAKSWQGIIHVFASKTERDAYVAEGFSRAKTSASDARSEGMSHPFVVCYGPARLPKSWGHWVDGETGETGHLAWNLNC